MNQTFKITLILLIGIISVSSIKAQNIKIGIPEIKYYDRSQYGGDRQNWRITQSQNDLLFFANNYGLLSFDGTHWTITPQNELLSCARSVKSIGNRIYIGASNELGYFEYNSNQKLIYNTLIQKPVLKTFGDYWDIVEYNNSIVFYSEKAICIFTNDKLELIIEPSTRFLGVFSVNGKLLVQDISKGLMEFNNGVLTPVFGGEIFLNKDIGFFTSTDKNKYIIGTLKDGLFIWDASGIKTWDVAGNSLLKKANILCGTSYLKKYLAFGTINMGLIMLDQNGEIITQLNKDKGLGNNTILSVFIDKEDNIWCGLDNGIAKISYNSPISFIQNYFDIGAGYAIDHFDGYYYLATIQALYRIRDEKFYSQLKNRNDFEKIEGTEGQCWSIYKDEETLLCGHTFGVFDIRNNIGTHITPPTVNGVWAFRKIPNNPNLLIAGTYDGLILLEKTNHQWRYRTKITGFTESARHLEWENDFTLMVAHSDNGVYRLTLNADYTQITKSVLFGFAEFPNNHLPLTLSLIDETCVFTSLLGLYIFNKESNKPELFTKYNSFFTEKQFPTDLKQDKFGNIWYFYQNRMGVLKNAEDGSIKKISFPFEPLKNKLVNYFQSSFSINQNNIFFNTENGFAHYLAQETKAYENPFKVHLTSFKNRADDTDWSLYQNNKQLQIPHFEFKNNSFEAQFAAPFFDDDNIQYSTFLSKVDESPSGWSNITNRSFSDLSEGEYTFNVVAKNRYGVESAPLAFRFIINPPWYRSLLAMIIYLLIITLALYIGKTLLSKYVQRAQKKATEISEKELIKLKNEKLSSEVVFKEKELATLTVHIIKKNDFLSDLKEQLARALQNKDLNEIARKVRSVIRKIDLDIENENSWTAFERHFEQIHATFLNSLHKKHPNLTIREQKLCAYLKMGMSSNEIASLMNISAASVDNNRYKLRLSLGLNSSDNLTEYIANL